VVKLKIAIYTSLIVLCFSSLSCLILYKTPVKVGADGIYDPKVIYVPTNYSTIQEAIDHADSGDTVFVSKGVYLENVVINNKSISLVGESADLTIVDGSETGSVVSIYTANNVSVRGFTIQRSGTSPPDSAIRIQDSSDVVISNNKITESNHGISMYSSSNNTIISNMVFSNSFNGVYLYSSSDNQVSGNVISDNYYSGVYIQSSSGNLISGNTISLSVTNYGVYFYFSSDNVVSGNTISLNGFGTYLTFSGNNTIYHNDFSNNTNQASCDPASANIWSYGGEGNYWSDYKGQDTNQDGIGNIPYDIYVNNKDYYPLMGSFSLINAAFKGETYDFPVISNSTIVELAIEIDAETRNRIVRFNATGKGGTVGFCRITLPTSLMTAPYFVLIDGVDTNFTLLDFSNDTYACLYFTYFHNSTVRIISSEVLHLYYELLSNYLDLNRTYYELLNAYNVLLESYTGLQENFDALNQSYQQLHDLNMTYYELLDNYVDLDHTYHDLLDSYNNLLGNYTELQDRILNSEQAQNTRNLTYIIAALTAIYIITTVYLSKRAHTVTVTRTRTFEEER
jgi:parallel beta-helix repeat protein